MATILNYLKLITRITAIRAGTPKPLRVRVADPSLWRRNVLRGGGDISPEVVAKEWRDRLGVILQTARGIDIPTSSVLPDGDREDLLEVVHAIDAVFVDIENALTGDQPQE